MSNGSVTIEINGTEYELICNRKAAQTVSRKAGGLYTAMQQLIAVNLDTMKAVIVAGADLKNKDASDLDDAIWDHGPSELIDPLVRYLNLLFNGGKEPEPTADADGGKGKKAKGAGASGE